MTIRRWIHAAALLGWAANAAAQQPIGPIQMAGLRAASGMTLAASSQRVRDDGWWRVEKVERGAEIRIVLRTGDTVMRTLERVGPDAVVASRGADPTQTTFAKSDIVEITQLHAYRAGNGRFGARLLGMAGAAVFGGLAAQGNRCAECISWATLGISAFGGALGAAVGYSAFSHPVDVTVYRAPKTTRD